jgi:hypothetical protein
MGLSYKGYKQPNVKETPNFCSRWRSCNCTPPHHIFTVNSTTTYSKMGKRKDHQDDGMDVDMDSTAEETKHNSESDDEVRPTSFSSRQLAHCP